MNENFPFGSMKKEKVKKSMKSGVGDEKEFLVATGKYDVSKRKGNI